MKGMKSMVNLIYIFLLAIWFCIMYYGTKLGLSVILFNIPLVWIIYKILKKNNKINNKKGLILLIPIFLLSLTYFIFDSLFFKILNFIVITILTILLFIMTIRPTFKVIDLIGDGFCIILNPLEYIGEVFRKVKEGINKKIHLKKELKKKLKSILIILPIIIVVLILLSSADMIFNDLISNILNIPAKAINHIKFGNIIARVLIIIAFFIYFSALLLYLLSNYQEEERDGEGIIKEKKKETDTIKLLLIVLNIIYIIFDIIQIKSLLLHSVGSTITYAEYARQGFFQLMVVSLINLCVILYTKKYDNKNDNKKIKALSILLVFLTFIIIISSFIRMYLYEQEFGYTLLRLLVYISLFTETICLIPTIIYIIKDKFNIVKSYMIIIITVYVIINYINIDKVIAIRNIDRYQKKNDIDIYYLMNNHADNIPELVDFLEEVKDKDAKKLLKKYLQKRDFETKDFREWNLAKYQARESIKNLK